MAAGIKTGLLSFGLSGRIFHAPFLNSHDGFDLCAVVERSNKAAHLNFPDIKSYDSVGQLLEDEDIELVVVNTPNNTHYEFALNAIQNNKHVLVEKPFTVTSDQAAHLFEQAEKLNRYILPYQNRRYDSDFISVKNVIDSGRLGRLVEAHFRFDRYKNTISSKLSKETQGLGNGVLYDLGSHLLDQVISLFGCPLEWKESLGYFREKTAVDDYAYLSLEFPQDLHVTITMSMLVADIQPAFILNGTLGSYVKKRADTQEKQLLNNVCVSNPLFGIEESGNEGILTTISADGVKVEEKMPSQRSSYINMFDRVYKTIKNAQPYPVTKNQILKQIEILES